MVSNKNPRKVSRRKRLGAYYTPLPVAQILADWAIRDRSDRVLDPSFGGCDFFLAAINTLRGRGCARPLRQIRGVDIDRKAVKNLDKLPGLQDTNGQFLTADFLKLRASNLDGWAFDAIVGNPPYVRHHLLSDAKITVAQKAVAEGGTPLPRSAGYWAYFVLHSLRFLERGGRLAMVLPGALLFAKYAQPVLGALSRGFATVQLVQVRERVFADAQEATVILLADNWGAAHKGMVLQKVETAQGLAKLYRNVETPENGTVVGEEPWGLKQGLISGDVPPLLDELASHDAVCQLRELANVRIGVVTGANSFFVLQPKMASGLGITERCLLPVFTKSAQIPGLVTYKTDVKALVKRNRPCLLLDVPTKAVPKHVEAYLKAPVGVAASKGRKCGDRRTWYVIGDKGTPDAFLTYMTGTAVRMVLNRAKALCTNAIHRLWFKERLHVGEQQVVALSSITSLSGLTAELSGRSYGGGVLKVEPSEASRVLVVKPVDARVRYTDSFRTASVLLAQGKWCQARCLADEAILRDFLGLKRKHIALLREAQDEMRRLRSSGDRTRTTSCQE